MDTKFKLLKTFPLGDSGKVLGIILLKVSDKFAVDLRVFDKSKDGLSATPMGVILAAEDVPEVALAMARAVEAAKMWAFLAEDDNEKPKAEKPRAGGKTIKKTKSDVVVQFPKGNGKDNHPAA